MANKKFVAYLHLSSWKDISLGLHIALNWPNVEIHLPFCFIRIGWAMALTPGGLCLGLPEPGDKQRTFGFGHRVLHKNGIVIKDPA